MYVSIKRFPLDAYTLTNTQLVKSFILLRISHAYACNGFSIPESIRYTFTLTGKPPTNIVSPIRAIIPVDGPKTIMYLAVVLYTNYLSFNDIVMPRSNMRAPECDEKNNVFMFIFIL